MIGADALLPDPAAGFLESTIETLDSEVFTDGLGSDHRLRLDRNQETAEEWREVVRRLGEQDLLGIPVPQELGGAGRGFLETALAEQALGYTGSIVHACQASLTQHIGHTLATHGSAYIHDHYLTPMCAGEYVVAQAFTEPGSGTDMAALGTTADRDGDGWRVTGEKRFIDFAPYADVLFVPVRTGGAAGDRDGISIFVVDGDAEGLEIVERHDDWHGFRGTGAAWIRFEDVHVPDRNLVGEEGAAWSYITDELNIEHVTIARYCCGAAERAMELAASYTEHRSVNERPLAQYQGVNHRIAELATRLDAAFALNTRAARVLDRDGPAAGRLEGAMAKQFGNEVAHEVADGAMQLMGGIGTTKKYPVERIQRDVRAGRYMGGATEVMKSVVQHDAYENLRDPDFPADRVGAELGADWG